MMNKHRSNRIKIVQNPWLIIDRRQPKSHTWQQIRIARSKKRKIWDSRRETFLCRALSSLETLAFSFMVDKSKMKSRIIGEESGKRGRGAEEKNLEETRRSKRSFPPSALSLSQSLSPLPLSLYRKILCRASDQERERQTKMGSILFGPFRLWLWFTIRFCFVSNFKIEISFGIVSFSVFCSE